MADVRITKAKRGKYLEITSPTDGALLQVDSNMAVKAVGFDLDSIQEAEESGELDSQGFPADSEGSSASDQSTDLSAPDATDELGDTEGEGAQGEFNLWSYLMNGDGEGEENE